MLIVHVIVGLSAGGAEGMLYRLIAAATQHRHIVISLTDIGPIGNKLLAQGHTVHVLRMRGALDFPRALLRLVRLLKTISPQVVQTWMYHADVLGGLAARIASVPKVCWGVRSTDIPQGVAGLTFWVVRTAALLSWIIPDRIICCANAARESHAKLGYDVKKLLVIPNGFDFRVFDRYRDSRELAREQHRFRPEDLVIGAVGRFDPQKDYENFVRAAALVSEAEPRARYLLVGKGMEWGNPVLRQWIEHRSLSDRFVLAGESTEVPFHLAAMDVFCLSSRSEAFPNVVVEAMAMGLVCAVTRAGDAEAILGAPEHCVPTRNSRALAEEILRILRMDVTTREVKGSRNRVRAISKFGIDAVVEQYEAAYLDDANVRPSMET